MEEFSWLWRQLDGSLSPRWTPLLVGAWSSSSPSLLSLAIIITTVVSCTTVDSPPPCCSLVIIIITVNSPPCFRFTIIITITNTITIVISHVGIGISLSPWWTEAWPNIVTIAMLVLGTNISPIFPQVEPGHNHHHWEPFHIWTSQYFCRRELAWESKSSRLNGNQGHIELEDRPCALTC